MLTDNATIFISYSTRDGSEAAGQLRQRLEGEGLVVWQDLIALRGGFDWWSQIEAILRAPSLEHLILIVSDSALERPVIQQEIRLARQEGVQVTPVLATSELDFTTIPRWLGHVLDIRRPEHWNVLINTLKMQSRQYRAPMMAPELPPDFVHRPVEFNALKSQIIDRRGDAIAITAALRGAGGYGKTTIAAALAHDSDIQAAYFDGILWVQLSETPGNLIAIICELIRALTGSSSQFATITGASSAFSEALGWRRILLIIDDVWREEHLRPFLVRAPNTTLLVTTRVDHVVPADAIRQPVDAMATSEATQLIASGLPTSQVQAEVRRLKNLCQRVGEWALLVKLVNGFLRQRVARAHEPLEVAIESVNARLDSKGLAAFDARNAESRSKAVSRTINTSLELLNGMQRLRFSELGIFPEDADIPIGVVARLWSESGDLNELETEDLLSELFDLSLLLDFSLQRRTVRLHDVVRHFLREDTHKEDLEAYESQLIVAMDEICTLPNVDRPELSFFLPLLPYYSVRARRWDMIIKCFSEPELLAKVPPGAYGSDYSSGTFHGPLDDALTPSQLNDISPSERLRVAEVVARAVAARACEHMDSALSYPTPWPTIAQKLRNTDLDAFARYRDSFYHFAILAGLCADWALIAFEGKGGGTLARQFIDANFKIYAFVSRLAMFGASDTGLSGALEDNLAGRSLHSWRTLEERANHLP